MKLKLDEQIVKFYLSKWNGKHSKNIVNGALFQFR